MSLVVIVQKLGKTLDRSHLKGWCMKIWSYIKTVQKAGDCCPTWFMSNCKSWFLLLLLTPAYHSLKKATLLEYLIAMNSFCHVSCRSGQLL